MSQTQAGEITGLLKAWAGGDSQALERLTPLVYDELRRLASRFMRRERPDNTLQPTALVNEAYIRLVAIRALDWNDRAHFMAMAAQTMRRVLIDAARARAAEKRGGDMKRVAATEVELDRLPDSDRAEEFCVLDDALTALAAMDPRRARVIELRFFGGLTVEETADALQMSPQSVMRDWRLARAWLMRELRPR